MGQLNSTSRNSFKENIEAIFNPCNIDADCDKIAFSLKPYKAQIKEMLKNGECHEAFALFYEILDSLSCHFVKDEHYCYFDDMYSPDYICKDMMEAIIGKIKEGVVADSELQYLKNAMENISKMEAYESYGVPFVVSDWMAFCRKYNVPVLSEEVKNFG